MQAIVVDLSPREIDLLSHGLMEWGGPAFATSELAVAMGFHGLQDMEGECKRLAEAIRAKQPLSPEDWTRALAATEVAFASEVWGSGWDWAITQIMLEQRRRQALEGNSVGRMIPNDPAKKESFEDPPAA